MLKMFLLIIVLVKQTASQYDTEFFNDHNKNKPAFQHLANLITNIANQQTNDYYDHPTTSKKKVNYLDVGCGHGFLVEALRTHENNHAYCIEGSSSAISFWPPLYREEFYQIVDLEKASINSLPESSIDVVISFEVAEHITPPNADNFIHLLTHKQPTYIFFTAATKQQGGLDHFNEQPMSYWINIFSKKGYHFDFSTTHQFRKDIIDQYESFLNCPWYSKNILIFSRRKQFITIESALPLEMYPKNEQWLTSLMPYGCNQQDASTCSSLYDDRDRAEFHMLRSKAIYESIRNQAELHLPKETNEKLNNICTDQNIVSFRIKFKMIRYGSTRYLILRNVSNLVDVHSGIQQWMNKQEEGEEKKYYLIGLNNEPNEQTERLITSYQHLFIIKRMKELIVEGRCVAHINLQILM